VADETPNDPGTTDRILAAAQEVFAAHGLDASLGEIAHVAGVGIGSIYRRFGNKDDLIQTLAERRFSEIVERMSHALDADDAWEAFATEFRRSVAEYASDRGFLELVIGSVTGSLGWARGSEPVRLRAAMKTWSAQVQNVIDRLITRAQAAGELRDDVTGSVIADLSIALQSITGLAEGHDHEKTIEIVLDGLRRR
jgi:AcrR family transcriptional regulator